ncbi:MAG: hypothetical protein QXR68_00890 [Pyrobaculum sp.]
MGIISTTRLRNKGRQTRGLFLAGENRILILWIYTLLSNVYAVQWNKFAAAALIYATPPVVLYVILQKFLKRGLALY